jgi:hypothetical protein
LAIAAQETLPFDMPMVDDSNRFFKSEGSLRRAIREFHG